ncbi:integrin-linked kinase-associated serine/threonine phosphatase 2C-like [Centruroides vittatus]|uniref:integrin-linked kinase-associated serine/threonine phosphatase 2C-like n=1 Tax=Centruroides vittatus TaxID=120091 RepID=UPI003510B4F4
MDLFEDLPEPSDSKIKEIPKKVSSVPSDDKIHSLFNDLPSPSNMNSNAAVKRKADDTPNISKPKKTLTGVYGLQGFFAERKGEREEMQDSHILFDTFHKNIVHLDSSICRVALYGVFDGHGGARASRHVADRFPDSLASSFPKGNVEQVEKEIKKCLLETFKKTDEEFLKEAAKSKPTWKDGTTAIIVLQINNTLYISNLGDSKAILCRFNEESKKYMALNLSKDHSPTDYEERMRIQKAGGYVRDGRVMGVLEVSRSFGDGQFKTSGVICLPDVRRCQLTHNDSFILLACDGLWKVFTSQEVISIVMKTLEDSNIQATDLKTAEEARYETACNRLVNEAVRKLSGDNVTVVIVAIQK